MFDLQRLSNAYDSLAQAYKKVVDVMGTGKRLLGKYFRVAFFGQVIAPLYHVQMELNLLSGKRLIMFNYVDYGGGAVVWW